MLLILQLTLQLSSNSLYQSRISFVSKKIKSKYLASIENFVLQILQKFKSLFFFFFFFFKLSNVVKLDKAKISVS